ncbi:hypothetical protein [Streptomyces sp. NPDC008092]|uniref:hypothetical protein n=1 Tax=Streptomyces sp. NPDC008092 TaxID=3364808 RepID=UPI0036EA8073
MTFTKCVFCLASGESVKITKEHLFSDWINDVLTPQVVGPNTSYERTSSTSSQPVTWPTPVVANVKARVACEPCNSGWMCDLEGVVKPILTGPVLGHATQFTPQEQLDIATWACMKAMVFEFAWSEPPAFTQPERGIVWSQKRPPASAQIRIAAIESQGYPL